MPTHRLLRFGRNAVSSLTTDVLNRATTFALYALVARQLGVFEVGQMSLALTFFYMAQVVAVAGLKTLITRDLARTPSLSSAYFAHGVAIVLISSAVSMLAIGGLVTALSYSAETALIILTISAALVPYALSAVFEGVLQSREEMHYMVLANIPVSVAKVLGAGWLLVSGHGLLHIALLIVASHSAIALIEGWLAYARIGRPRLQIQPSTALAMVRATGAFFSIDGAIALLASAEVVILSKLVGESAVGLYSSASQLLVPITLVCQSIVLSAFPMMCRRSEAGIEGLRGVAISLASGLLALVLPATIGLFFLAGPLLGFLYGDQRFLDGGPVLQVLAWTLVLRVFTVVFGHTLLASGRESITLRIVALDGLVGLALSAILISRFGLMGAAIGSLLTRTFDFALHAIAVSSLISRVSLNKIGWYAILASGVMASYLVLARSDQLVIAGLGAGVIYTVALAALMATSSHGFRHIADQFVPERAR